MAHQFSALHNAPFVAVSHTTRERLRQVNITALGLITEMTAHVDGFPVTLDTIIKRAKKPGAAALREAYQDLIEERLLVYIRYTLQIPGQRPYQSSTTVIAREAITDAEFGERITGKATPGQIIFDQQPDGEVRKVKILAATVRYWGGEKKINGDGVLVAPGPKKKPGPKKGTRSGQQPTAPPATNSVEEPGTRSSSMSRENEKEPQGVEEPGTRSSSMSRENDPSDQGNEELGDEESSLPGSLTRPGDKTTNQTTGHTVAAAADESAGLASDGWLESSAEDDGEGTGGEPSAGYTLLTDLGVRGTPRSQWAETVTHALHVLGPTPVGTQLTGGKTTPGPGAIVQTRLPGLAEQLVQARQKPKQAAGASSGSATVWPTWCGGCERDDRRYENQRGAWVKCPSCHPYANGNGSGDAAFLDQLGQMAGDAA